MARGAAPGERRGGRLVGSRNRATIARDEAAAKIAAQAVVDSRVSGRKLGKEILDDFANLFAGMAAHYQPTPPGAPKNPYESEKKFLIYSAMAVDCAYKKARYESPTFQAVAVQTNSGELAPPPAAANRADGPTPDSRAQQSYLTMILGGKG